MPKYKLTSSRHDVPEETIKTFDARDDAVARKEFEKVVRDKQYSWDDIQLLEIIAPAVAEKTRSVSTAWRQGRAGQEIVHHTSES